MILLSSLLLKEDYIVVGKSMAEQFERLAQQKLLFSEDASKVKAAEIKSHEGYKIAVISSYRKGNYYL